MPIYEYECEDHGIFSEFHHTMDIEHFLPCPICGKKSKKIISKPGKHIVDFRPGWNAGAGQYFDKKEERETWIHESGSVRIKD